ncbi:tRNA (guanosine(37)-N1)-methyltransferase TrmD [Eubacteriales bacterium OttesenSCG-928-K08]|nr:tRNA (guanosine(37)-N1)-methyltransferase TrmD [Eubacteriales bacterium OttesenSCG-928-K08]
MRIDVLTLFPEMFPGVLTSSMLGRAQAGGILDMRVHDIRAYSDNKHKRADDYPFGGGAGLVMMAQPIYSCVEAVLGDDLAYKILLSPRGRKLTPSVAHELAGKERLLLLCGHYEGVDERVMEIMDEEISIGDYVLTGGELPAMVLIDCVARFIPGVLGCAQSAQDESFSDGLLEYPQYTRPAEFRGMNVPEILLNGHHANIEAWRKAQAVIKTKAVRPELLEGIQLTKLEEKMLRMLENENPEPQ